MLRAGKIDDRAAGRKAAALLRVTLRRNGWPDGERGIHGYFRLNPYGRVSTYFVRRRGFWMHLEGDGRIVHGPTRDACVDNLIRMLDPEVERIIRK